MWMLNECLDFILRSNEKYNTIPNFKEYVRGLEIKGSLACFDNNNKDILPFLPQWYEEISTGLLFGKLHPSIFKEIPDYIDIKIKSIAYTNEMDHCRKQHSTPPATGTKPPAKKFTKTLSSNQQDYLYNKLTEKSVFLPIETGRESFNFVFGGSVKPDSFQPLEWQKNVQLLRELLEPLQHPDIPVKEDYVKQVPDYFIKKDGSRLKLAKPKAKYDTLSDKLTEIIENLATL